MEAKDGPDTRQDAPLLRAPDVLTVLRIPLAVMFLLIDSTGIRLLILAIVAASDVGDGIWARRIGGSKLGAALDPFADKVFMAAAFFVVFRSGLLSPWEILAVLLRDILAGITFLGALMRFRPTTLPARAGGKAVTVGQGLALVAFLAGSDLLRPLAWATAAISLYAIADYVSVARNRRDR